MSRRRILFVSADWPQGCSFGGQLRAVHVARALREVGEVTVVVVGSEANNEEAMRKTEEEYNVQPPIVPLLSPRRGVAQKLGWAFDPRHLDVHGYVVSAEDRNRIRAEMERFDLVWLLHARTPNILQIWNWPHSNLDMSDVPSTYSQTIFRNATNLRKRAGAFAQKVMLQRRESLLKERFTTISVCSEADRDYLGAGGRIHVIPNGFERPRVEPLRALASDPPRIGFIGLYSYEPNLDGVRWFLKNVWPTVQRAVPGIRFRLLGKDTDGPLKPVDSGVDALGWMDDAAKEIGTWSAMVIPIRFGGGTRIKIADAFSRKCPVVSTRLGAFGYEVKHQKELLLADDSDAPAFARHCISLVQRPARGVQLAEEAYRAFSTKWTWDAIAPRVVATAEDCLRRSAAHPSRVTLEKAR